MACVAENTIKIGAVHSPPTNAATNFISALSCKLTAACRRNKGLVAGRTEFVSANPFVARSKKHRFAAQPAMNAQLPRPFIASHLDNRNARKVKEEIHRAAHQIAIVALTTAATTDSFAADPSSIIHATTHAHRTSTTKKKIINRK